VDHVIEEEGVKIDPTATEALVRLSKGDMRRALNVLQACHASSTPLQPPGQPPPDPKTIQRDTITESTIYDCIAAPHPADIKTISETLLTTTDITSCLQTINLLKAAKGLALADILTALAEELGKLDVPVQTRVMWLEGLSEVEYRLSGGGSETVQTGGLVGVVRGGAELVTKKEGKK
jgi:replication factor C subunit 3/5